MSGQAITGLATAKSDVALLARIRGNGGALVTQASLTSVSVVVTDTVTATSTTLSPSVASVIYDALQQDPRWQKDSPAAPGPDGSAGYNFLYVVSGTTATGGSVTDPLTLLVRNNRMQADVILTPVSGGPFRVSFSWVPGRVFA